MANFEIEIQVNFHSRTPLHIGTGLSKGGVIDKSVIKGYSNKNSQNVYIPGSSIKGKLKYLYSQLYKEFISSSLHHGQAYCRNEAITDCCSICQFFGSRFHRGSLIFSDAKLVDIQFIGLTGTPKLTDAQLNFVQTNLRKGIKMSRLRKTTLEKHLFVLESASAGLIYQASITGRLYSQDSHKDIPRDIKLFLVSLNILDRLGGGKSRGMGYIKTEIVTAKVDGTAQNVNQLISEL